MIPNIDSAKQKILNNIQSSLKTKMNKLGIREVEFKFDYEGTKSIAI